ncbi:tetratricopeptide repeat protein [Mucilaginibacter sp. BJC16-A38]|uniref:tetratricopeptide repeat protein n=1 Tax=Mucilaginibacter phenanthrenivorans TaxID=1234842 RepID=UPI0021582EB5|nr:tetratricopeptide repeat protein [Mucilaginibacter phenanthrenivorans]MCR8556193.1 tetratricopeptide repeat protein [Mucilaginibacter phenanthrenivorans]
MKTIAATLIFIAAFTFSCFAQTPKETAHQKGVEAVKLEDAGKFDDALKLLDEAQKLDPDNIVYPYEMGYCYYSQEHYQKVVDLLEKLKDRPDSFDRLYELLGNSYDVLKQSDKAIAVYEDGLKKFPNSGVLYLERGTMPLTRKNYSEAIKYFEKGIEVEPKFPSNYYWAAKIYCGSESAVWGLLYGEIFMNIERNSKRTGEISKLLFDTYKKGITFPSADKTAISFSKQNTMTVDDLNNKKLPYGITYEMTMSLATLGERTIDLNSLDRIRQNFLKVYKEKGTDKTYPNVLFTYQDQISQANNMEAYDHWLLMMGDEAAFNTWKTANQSKWENFIKWYGPNPLQLDAQHRFHRNMF